jgi:hypothetical protein
MQRASSSLIIKKTRNAKKPNTKPRKSDGDKRLKIRNKSLKFGTWNVRGCRNKMEEIVREINVMKKNRKDYVNGKFQWSCGKYGTRNMAR